MALADPAWELADPTPDVHALFVAFDARFFWQRLGGVCVRWSKRMYSCAGVCRYQGRGGMCDIALSEPLLKLRPRKDLIETLLHEMIHAYLFLTDRDTDRDGHGPNFQKHMHRINKEANINISIYHDFHDEVRLYQTHVWRCSGPCQTRKPFFGIVRRSSNRAPGPNDFWWQQHQMSCGGRFEKISEPEKKSKAPTKSKKPKEQITKYTNTSPNIKIISDITNKTNVAAAISNGGNTLLEPNKMSSSNNTIPLTNVSNKITPVNTWAGKGKVLGSNAIDKVDVVQTVRNHWANKTLSASPVSPVTTAKGNKRISSEIEDFKTPPPKINKIENYFIKSPIKTPLSKVKNEPFTKNEFKTPPAKIDLTSPSTSHSPNVKIQDDAELSKEDAEALLKDIYGQDFTLGHQKSEDGSPTKFCVINKSLDSTNGSIESEEPLVISEEIVDCPVCSKKLNHSEVNNHLDICLLASETGNGPQLVDLTNGIAEVYGTCLACNNVLSSSLDEHLDVCQLFKNNNRPVSKGGPSSSTPVKKEVVVLLPDDDGDIDETNTFNQSGTMYPCPCCMKMIEENLMNRHIDECLNTAYLENLKIESVGSI